MSKHYLGTVELFLGNKNPIPEQHYVLFRTKKDPREVLNLIAKNLYTDGGEEPVNNEDEEGNCLWIYDDGCKALPCCSWEIKKSTYDDLEGKIYIDPFESDNDYAEETIE